MTRLIFIILALLSFTAGAGSFSITCVPPTERADGMAIDSSEIKGYNFYIVGPSSSYPRFSPACDYTETGVAGGDYTIDATTVDINDLESITRSNQVVKTVPFSPILPPVIQ